MVVRVPITVKSQPGFWRILLCQSLHRRFIRTGCTCCNANWKHWRHCTKCQIDWMVPTYGAEDRLV